MGSLLGAFWDLRSLKPVLESVWERSRAAKEHFYSALAASKSLPSGPQEASRLPRQVQELSRRLQDRIWSDFGVILEPLREPFWTYVGAILGQGCESLFVAI